MDKESYFVNEFCNRLSAVYKNLRSMYTWYEWSDKRPGTTWERFDQDAKEHAEYTRLFQC